MSGDLRLQPYLILSGAPIGGGSSPPPPPPAYTTGGVRFDGATSLINAALAATDNAVISFSGWFFYPSWTPVPIAFASDPDDNDSVYFEGQGTTGQLNWNVSTSDFSIGVEVTNNSAPVSLGEWVWFAGTANLAGTPSAKLVQNGVDVTTAGSITGTDGTLTFNGLPFGVGYDFGGFTGGYMADLWIAPGVTVDFTDAPTQAKFYNAGKPVSLGADGSTPTGTAPAIFLRRAPAAAASTFATNLGTGGNFTITGTLTNAPSSPSD